MIQQLMVGVAEVIPWMIASAALIAASASFFYAYRTLATADRRLAAIHAEQQRLRQTGSRLLLQEARVLWEGLGTDAEHSRRLADVLGLLDQAGDLDPGNLEIRHARAVLLRKAGRLEDARREYEQLLESAPDDEVALRALEKLSLQIAEKTQTLPHPNAYERGRRLLQEARPVEAEQVFRRLLSVDPISAQAHSGLGEALLAQGRSLESEAAWREAVRLDPRHVPAWRALARLLVDQHRYREASPICRQTMLLEPDRAEVHLEFAQALLLLVLPMCFVGALSLRTARKIRESGDLGPPLIKRLMMHRFMTQLIGVVSIFVTAMYGMYKNLYIGVIGY